MAKIKQHSGAAEKSICIVAGAVLSVAEAKNYADPEQFKKEVLDFIGNPENISKITLYKLKNHHYVVIDNAYSETLESALNSNANDSKLVQCEDVEERILNFKRKKIFGSMDVHKNNTKEHRHSLYLRNKGGQNTKGAKENQGPTVYVLMTKEYQDYFIEKANKQNKKVFD